MLTFTSLFIQLNLNPYQNKLFNNHKDIIEIRFAFYSMLISYIVSEILQNF